MPAPRVLVAGIGNVFLGDDGFGVAVAQQLAQRSLPPGVRVVDFGIRSFDLAFAMLDDYDAVILVDALPGGGAPGTLYVLEPRLDANAPQPAGVQGHSLDPVSVLQLVRTYGGEPRRLRVVGCEPATFGPEGQGQMGLSAAVQAAVEPALQMLVDLIDELCQEVNQHDNSVNARAHA
jgi:hydrogenase maturation protease